MVWGSANAGNASAFARPEIELPGFVTPQLLQGKKIARDCSLSELAEFWQHVAGQVKQQGLALGVHAELPPKRDRPN